MKILVLPIRFGFSAPSAVPNRHKAYYREIIHFPFADLVDPLDVQSDFTLPIASEHSLSHTDFVKIVCGAALSGPCDGLLIDVGGPDEKEAPRYNAVLGLVLAIPRLLEEMPHLRIAVMLPVPVAAEDCTAPALRVLAQNARVRLMFGDGSTWGSYFETAPPNRKKVQEALSRARTDPLDVLEKKLIRRVGHYRLPSSPTVIRSFYDGQKACDEIYDILVGWIEREISGSSVQKIIYDARHSRWFRAPVEAALRDAGLQLVSHDIDRALEAAPNVNTDVILVPIVRTGASLRQLLAEAVPVNGRLPRVWSLLSTEGALPRAGTRSVKVGNSAEAERMITVEYAVRVATANAASDGLWQDAPIEAIDPASEDLGSALSADAMWGMILEAGMTPEAPVPRRRLPIGYVPNFGRLAELNGPYIAARVEAILRKKFPDSLAPSLAFLCPDEPHARQLAISLRNLAGHDTVHVSRGLIEDFHNYSNLANVRAALSPERTTEFEKVAAALSSWESISKTLSFPERPQIVLLDEFDYTGGTFMGLYNLASAFSLNIKCSVSVARFGRSAGQGQLGDHVALYEIDYSG